MRGKGGWKEGGRMEGVWQRALAQGNVNDSFVSVVAENMKRWGGRTKARRCLWVTVRNCVAKKHNYQILSGGWQVIVALRLWSAADKGEMQHRQQTVRQGSLHVRQNLPHHHPPALFSVTDGPPLSHEMYCRNPCSQMYSDASNQQINTGGKKRQRVWLKYFKYPPLFFRMVSNSQDVYTCRVCALFWQSLSPVCLLIEILIDVSEGDFNHKGVVHAYLSEPQKEEKNFQPTLSPFSYGSLCQERNVPEDTSPIRAM